MLTNSFLLRQSGALFSAPNAGVPIPIIHCPKCGPVPVPDKDLPVTLPPFDSLREPNDEQCGSSDAVSPLSRAPAEWLNVPCPCEEGIPSVRDTVSTLKRIVLNPLSYASPFWPAVGPS